MHGMAYGSGSKGYRDATHAADPVCAAPGKFASKRLWSNELVASVVNR
jgi:hypothetical protein